MFYLDDTKIAEPQGYTNVYWKRSRNMEYMGIWRHRQSAVIDGIGSLGFEGQSARLLRTLFDQAGPSASVGFRIQPDGGQTAYESEVDFSMFNDDGRYWWANFRDQDGIELDALADLVIGLAPQIQIEFPEQPLSAGITYEVETGQRVAMQVFSSSGYALPLKAAQQGEGSGLSVERPNLLEPIYLNRTDRTARIDLLGKIVGTFSGSGTIRILAQVTAEGSVREEVELAYFSASGSEQQIILSQSIQIPPGAYLRVIGQPQNNLTVTHGGDTYLTLYENAQTGSSLVAGLTFKQAVQGLLDTLTGGKMTLSSSYLTRGIGATRVLTSEPNLRGYQRDIQVSFNMLWQDMKRMDNLACWRRGDTLYIETVAQMIRQVGRSYVTHYEKLSHGPSPFFVSRIGSGYDLWSSGTAAGREEFCSPRMHLTGQPKVKESVDLVCRNLSASGKLMELLRRNPQGQSSDSGFEERLFVIVADKDGSTYKARTGGVTGVTSPDTVINADISPRQNLARWMNIYGINGTATFSSGQANTSAVVNGSAENRAVQPTTQLFTKRTVVMDTSMTMQEYEALGEVIEYDDHDGQQRAFLVTADSYHFSSGKVMLEGIELDE